jgi:predicted glycoside hydrolase/deacetylase ChbG (UPF0249 family)
MKAIILALSVVVLSLASLIASATAPPQTVQQRLGYPADARLLIIHADDLGMSHSVNRATFVALERGWITSSSILVPCPWFAEVATWARAHQDADLGIHLAVNSEWTTLRWPPISGRAAVPSLIAADGYMALDEDAVVAHARPAEVDRELRAQIDFAKSAGVPLTHLDSHMATLFHTRELFEVYRRLGADYGLPQLIERLGSRGGARSAWETGAAGSALIDRVISIDPGVSAGEWEAAYEKMLAPLPPGVYQLIVHLGYDDDEMRGATADHPNWGAAWRQHDLDLVKSDRFQAFLKQQHFVPITWAKLGTLAR